MCASYTPTRNETWGRTRFGVPLPAGHSPETAYPGYLAPIAALDDRHATICRLARFGLVPHWAKDATIGRRTYNARVESVAEKPSYRTPWRRRQFAIALLDDFFEPCWETGKAVRWRIRRADGQPMGAASIRDQWIDPQTGEAVHSFSMLTVNADGHPVMGRFHRPGDEKRSLVVLEPGQFRPWLEATVEQAAAMCVAPAPDALLCGPDAPASKIPSLFD